MSDQNLLVLGVVGGVGIVAIVFFVFLCVILLTLWDFMREGSEYFRRENARYREGAEGFDDE